MLPYAIDGATSSGSAKRISATELAGEEEEEDNAVVNDDLVSDEDNEDASKDKMIKAVPVKKATAGSTKGKPAAGRAKRGPK